MMVPTYILHKNKSIRCKFPRESFIIIYIGPHISVATIRKKLAGNAYTWTGALF